MHSRAESRVLLERVLRAVVIVALAVMLWQSLREQTDLAGHTVRARGAALGASLGEWGASPRVPESIQVHLDNVPPPSERAWLGALVAAGSRLSWSGDVPATMIDAQPVASPAARMTVTVAAPNGVPIVVRDEVGVIDTVRVQRHGASLALSSVTDQIRGSIGNSVASTHLRDSILLRKVLVIGNAGWESKFVVAALDEAGWKLDALIRVGPNVDVAQGSATVIDTVRYSAVVALDGASLPYASRIIEFARTGGGVVLSPQASRVEALAILRSGAVGRAIADSRRAPHAGLVDLRVLPFIPISSLRSDATALEKRSGVVVTAATRVGAGRTLQLGYEETWRWRMGGDEAAVRGHREWWTGLVGSVAYVPRIARPKTVLNTDVAPMVGLVSAIGPGNRAGTGSIRPGGANDWMVWLFALLPIALVGEVMSRRLRGTS
ncbi:MAG TPA: hypothetical protein VM939_05645 [Gemmatimonadaceae bacterium]|nr:hypothetical protein [Gemmatimonadaceae bacterium]